MWDWLSEQYAQGARGVAKVLSYDALGNSESTFVRIEFPALKKNPLVDMIVQVNPDTGAETILWTRPPS